MIDIGYSNGTLWTLELVVQHLKNRGYALISPQVYKNVNENMIIIDEEGYLYSTSFLSILKNTHCMKVHTLNPFTIYNIKLWFL